jgi:hypothetical protein
MGNKRTETQEDLGTREDQESREDQGKGCKRRLHATVAPDVLLADNHEGYRKLFSVSLLTGVSVPQ